MEPSASLLEHTDILAHLFFAAGTRDRVLVSFPQGELEGILGNPDGPFISLKSTRAPPPLPTGTPLCLEHVSHVEKYHFYSEVVTQRTHELRIRVPEAIEHTERRLSERVNVPVGAGIAFRWWDLSDIPAFPVQDLSSGGFSFRPMDDTSLVLGQVFQGELLLPGGPPVPVTVDVRHLRSRSDAHRVGVCILEISLAGRGRLARALAELAR